LALFGGQPVSQAYAQVPYPFDAADAGREIGAQQATIGRLVCQTSYRAQTKIHSAGSQLAQLQETPVTHHNGPVESQTRF
jgi:hypothetical protein